MCSRCCQESRDRIRVRLEYSIDGLPREAHNRANVVSNTYFRLFSSGPFRAPQSIGNQRVADQLNRMVHDQRQHADAQLQADHQPHH